MRPPWLENNMVKYKEGRYVYYVIPESNMVKCVSTYGKKPFIGISRCSKDDVFNESIGKYIARIRCDKKINRKRIETLSKDFSVAQKESRFWVDRCSMICELITKANNEKKEIDADLKKIESELI